MSIRWLCLNVVSALWIVAPSSVSCQQPLTPVDSATVSLARRLLHAMHLGETILAGIESAMTEQRRQSSRLPAVFYDSLRVRMERTIPEVLDSLAPEYARRFNNMELQSMIQFFESPAGRDLASQQANLGVEAAQFGRRWGVRLAATVIKDLTDAGIDLTKP